MKNNINIVKIGSEGVCEENIEKLLADAASWEEKTGEKFAFISSGAVKLGKDRVKESGKDIKDFERSSLASIGQQFLMEMYDRLSGKSKLVGEILLDDYVNKKYIEKLGIKNGSNNSKLNKFLRPCCC